MFMISDLLIIVGASGLIWYYLGYYIGARTERRRYTKCLDEKRGNVEYIRRAK